MSSVEQSLTRIISISNKFWFCIDLIDLNIKFLELYTGIIALTFGKYDCLNEFLSLIYKPWIVLFKKGKAFLKASSLGRNNSSLIYLLNIKLYI